MAETTQTETVDVNLHGSCSKCHHWHDSAPLTVWSFPGAYNGFCCAKCGHKMFGLGGNSTHTSLASQETLAVFRTSTFDSDTSIVWPEQSPAGSYTPYTATSLQKPLVDIRFGDQENALTIPRGREKRSNPHQDAPSPHLLSPVLADAVNSTRLRSHSAPPRQSNDHSETGSPITAEVPRRTPSIGKSIKKGIKKVANRLGYDFVKLGQSPTSPSTSPAGLPQVSMNKDHSNFRAIPPIHLEDTLLQHADDVGSRSAPPCVSVYRHSKNHQPSPREEIDDQRRQMTAVAQVVNAQSVLDNSSISTHEREATHALPQDRSISASRGPEFTPSSQNGSPAANSSQSSVLEIGSVDGLPQHTRSENQLGTNLPLTTSNIPAHQLTSQMNSSIDGLSNATTAFSAPDTGTSYLFTSASTTSLHGLHGHPSLPSIASQSPRVSLSYPYPTSLRISTDLSSISSGQSGQCVPGQTGQVAEMEDGDGGLTPIAAGGAPRRSFIFHERVSPEDILMTVTSGLDERDHTQRVHSDHESTTATIGGDDDCAIEDGDSAIIPTTAESH